jgi:hypothetical protein
MTGSVSRQHDSCLFFTRLLEISSSDVNFIEVRASHVSEVALNAIPAQEDVI